MTGKRWSWAILILLAFFPSALLAQSDQRIPLELRNQTEEKIGQSFFQDLTALVNKSTKFRLAKENEPKITLTVGSHKTENPFLSVVTVIWTTDSKTPKGNLPVYLDFLMAGISAAHAYKDAEDTLDFTDNKIVKRFRELSGQNP